MKRSRGGWWSALSAAALVVASEGCARRPAVAGVTSSGGVSDALRGTPATLPLETVNGQRVDVAEHRGKGVLLTVISVDHMGSQALVRNLERLAREHPDDLAVIVTVADRSDPAALRIMMETFRDVLGLRHVVLTAASDEVRNGTSVLGEVRHVPTSYLFNRAGALVRSVEGYQSPGQLEALVRPTLPR